MRRASYVLRKILKKENFRRAHLVVRSTFWLIPSDEGVPPPLRTDRDEYPCAPKYTYASAASVPLVDSHEVAVIGFTNSSSRLCLAPRLRWNIELLEVALIT
jgi:hypothetical protein